MNQKNCFSRGSALISFRALAALLLALGCTTPLPAAELKLGSLFGDHMVLQRDRKICVWGTGGAGASVVVKIDSQHVTAIVGADQTWKAYLKPRPAGGPYQLTVAAPGSSITVTDVFYGDVWLCSGQSNMQMPVKECVTNEQAAALASYPHLRLGTVAKAWNAKRQTTADITWVSCNPQAARDFSAVGFFFASELLKDAALTNVPIAVLNSCLGGTTCEGWIPDTALAHFNTNELHDSMFGIKPAMLYNGMIAPLGEAAFKGVIWYQGEGNAGHPGTYPRLLSTLITEWRQQFATPELPFFIIQLPDFANLWDGLSWSWERDAQASAVQSTPHTSLVLGIGTTDGLDLHPKQKLEIGRRTALAVRRDAYGEKLVGHGPVFKSAKVKAAAIRVTFDTEGDGLAMSGGPTNTIRGFEIAGVDGVYHPAQASVERDSVVLRCDQVPSPKTARYAWAGVPDANLVNHSGLPTAPFRTDKVPPRS